MEFPILISGVLAQTSAVRYTPSIHIEHFFEGYTRQSQLRTDASPMNWRLNYSNLTPEEAMRLRTFFEALPVDGTFSFVDPWTGLEYPDCRLANPRLDLACDRDHRFSAQLEIENAG